MRTKGNDFENDVFKKKIIKPLGYLVRSRIRFTQNCQELKYVARVSFHLIGLSFPEPSGKIFPATHALEVF